MSVQLDLVYLASAGWTAGPTRLVSRLFAALALVAAWGTLTFGLALTVSLGWDARLCFASRLFSGFLGPLLFLFTLAYLGRLERWSSWCLLMLLPGLAATAQFLLLLALVPEGVVREAVQRFSLGGATAGAWASPLEAYPWYRGLLLVHTLQQYSFRARRSS